jgi:hypothetical protein
VSVVVISGRSPRGGGRLFFAPRVVPEKFTRSHSVVTGSVTRGRDILGLTKSLRWMMMGKQCFRASEVAAIMTVAIRSMLSVMRKGK